MITEFRTEPDFNGFSAVDDKDGTVNINIVGNYDITKAGIYPMNVTARDKAGNSSRLAFNVIVKAHERQGELDDLNALVADCYEKWQNSVKARKRKHSLQKRKLI